MQGVREHPTRDTAPGVLTVPAPSCYVCGRTGKTLYLGLGDRHFPVPGVWDLRECPECRVVWLDPTPLQSEIHKLYPDYYTHRPRQWTRGGPASLPGRLKRGILNCAWGYARDHQALGDRLIGTVAARLEPLRDQVGGSVLWLHGDRLGRLLDIGCGSGEFLADMRELGWTVQGVEPDANAAGVARDAFHLDVFTGSIEEAHFEDGAFDAVTLCHVIEHVLDPVALLAECRRLLRRGGRLSIVTPNVQSQGRRLLGAAWIFWDPPRHLNLFTRQTLEECARRANLEIVSSRASARRASWVWSNSRLLQHNGETDGLTPPIPRRFRVEGRAFWLLQSALNGIKPIGEELVLIATRR